MLPGYWRERQIIAVLFGRYPGCCPRHRSTQVRRCICSLSGYCSAAVPRNRKALGWQGQRNQKDQQPDARMHREQTSTGQLSFQKHLPLGSVVPPKRDSDLLAWCFCCPVSHTANLQGYLGSIPWGKPQLLTCFQAAAASMRGVMPGGKAPLLSGK